MSVLVREQAVICDNTRRPTHGFMGDGSVCVCVCVGGLKDGYVWVCMVRTYVVRPWIVRQCRLQVG